MILLCVVALLTLPAQSQICGNYTDYKYFITTLNSSLNNGTCGVFLWNDDWNTNTFLGSQDIDCLATRPYFETLGLYTDYDYGTNSTWVYDIYNTSTLESFQQQSLSRQLILLFNFDPTVSPHEQVRKALKQFSDLNVTINMVWLRPNVDPNCPEPTAYINCQFLSFTENIDMLTKAVEEVEALGYNVGIYTNQAAWTLVINNSTFEEYPLMYDGEDYGAVDSSFDDFEAFGGWIVPTSKMSQNWYLDPVCCKLAQITWTPNTAASQTFQE
jgi:hypothetical protein